VSTFDDKQPRRIVPRWRDSVATVVAGELVPFVTGERALPPKPSIEVVERRLAEWRKNPSVPFAADAVGVALVSGRPELARDAATFLLRNDKEGTPASRRLANVVLGLESFEPGDLAPTLDQTRAAIHRLRVRLRGEPRNSIGWIDLARHYVVVGLPDKAVDAMRRALALEPDNRFALRSAARLHLHRRDVEEALRVLRKSERTKTDPWLLASEVAVATVADRQPRFIKLARAAVASRSIDPKHTSELASALATIELREGHRGEARRLFHHALVSPNENVIAQAEWATQNLPTFHVPKRLLERPRSFEARAWEAYRSNRWMESFNEAMRWQSDEPFSSRPARMGTFVGSVLVQDYVRSEAMARRALQAWPDDFGMRNNLVFSLASAGQLPKANVEAAAMKDELLADPRNLAVWTATQGLLAFREGSIAKGRALYNAAIVSLGLQKDADAVAYAAAFLAREELLAGTPESIEALAQARKLAQGSSSQPLQAVILGLPTAPVSR